MNERWTSPRGDVILLLADCRSVGLPDVDAIISDPPYGIDYNQSGGNRFSAVGVTRAAIARGSPKIYGDDEPFDPRPWLTVSPNVMLWGADHFFPRLPDSGRWLAWNKLADMEPWDSFSDVEFAWHSADTASRIFSMKWKGIACDKKGENNGLREHPTQKPIALMRWCVDQSNVPDGGTVLDPYMGSGTTGVACVQTRRRFVGIECEERWYRIAVRRITEALQRRDEGLFGPAPLGAA